MRAVVLALLFSLVTIPAIASDGVLEINQTCAVQTGCFSGDVAGFPVTISTSGSYLLTSELIVDQTITVIEISTIDVTLDLGGFTIRGPALKPIGGTCSVQPGPGSGIRVPNAGTSGTIVRNGRVRGMPGNGVDLELSPNSVVEGVIAEQNCVDGIVVGLSGFVADSLARSNGFTGIRVAGYGRVRDSIADSNSTGIYAPNSVVTGSVTSGNTTGINLSGATPSSIGGGVVMGNVIASNVTVGVQTNGTSNTGGLIVNNQLTFNGVGATGAINSGVGGNVLYGNQVSSIGVTIDCNAIAGGASCPP
ncbi:MAG: hypothetical protein H6748_15510 [Spirochaetaceae bacterium]|nr:hypothetical protein [Myxococcales bacterium]MCB9725456.1 hypothetical protein [Spirochaetaceae bacterium]HPG26046.1 hypothetical protein [Myxococcota bacterium]